MQVLFENVIKSLTPLTLIKFEKIEEGVMTDKYLLTAASDSGASENFIIRIYPQKRRGLEHFEPALFRIFNEKEIKSPEYIGSSIEYPFESYKYILYKFLPGRSLTQVYHTLSDEDKSHLIREIIENLVKITEIECNGYGTLSEGLNAKYESWQAFLFEAYYNGREGLKASNIFEVELLNEFHRIFPLPQNRTHSECNLVWLDFHPDNIIVDDSNRLSGFVDFEEMISGDPAVSIAYLYARLGNNDFYNRIIKEFFAKVGAVSKNSIAEYAMLRAFRIAPYLSEKLPTGRERDNFFSVFKGLGELNSIIKNRDRRPSPLRWAFSIEDDIGLESGNRQRIRAASTLVLSSMLIVSLFLVIFVVFLENRRVTKVFWNNQNEVSILSQETPNWFNYENDSLATDITISMEDKSKLIQSFPDSILKDDTLMKSINNLVFRSRQSEQSSIFLILACGIISVIGVMIRSLWDFVGNASYKDEININRWWPWYLLRPFIGFMGGVVFFFLYSGGVIDINTINLSKPEVYWLLGLSTIVGFGLNDFVTRLRLVSKAALGGNSN